MPELDGGWEYYVADPEVSELLEEHHEQVVRATRCRAEHGPESKFFFAFAGDRTMSAGRFFDGIRFGKSGEPWFLWDVGRRSSEFLLGLFEESLADIDKANRTDYLARSFCRAWDRLPERLGLNLQRLLSWEPGPREPDQRGRTPGPVRFVASRYGLNRSCVWRDYLRAKFTFLCEAIPGERLPKCACGCGGAVTIAYVDNKTWGHRAGRPNRFITGHSGKRPDLCKPASVPKCPYCRNRHQGRCPLVKCIEYFESGQVRRIEFHQKAQMALPDGEA